MSYGTDSTSNEQPPETHYPALADSIVPRVVQRFGGILVDHIRYVSPQLFLMPGSLVEVRLNPADIGSVFVRIDGDWLEIQAEHYSVFAGISRTELYRAQSQIRFRSHQTRKGVPNGIRRCMQALLQYTKGRFSPDSD